MTMKQQIELEMKKAEKIREIREEFETEMKELKQQENQGQ